MDLSLSDEQKQLQDGAERFVRDKYTFENRRKIVATERGWLPENWTQFAELGWLGMAIDCEQCSVSTMPRRGNMSFREAPAVYSVDAEGPALRAGIRRGLQRQPCEAAEGDGIEPAGNQCEELIDVLISSGRDSRHPVADFPIEPGMKMHRCRARQRDEFIVDP